MCCFIELKGFQWIVVLIDGIVMQCNVDVGDFVNFGNVGCVLFMVVQVDWLCLYVQVLQVYVQQVKVGQYVSVVQVELLGWMFDGMIMCMFEVIDVVMCLLQIEIILLNLDGWLLFGVYVQVMLLMMLVGCLQVLVNMLLFCVEGLMVVVVDVNGQVYLKQVMVVCMIGQMFEVDGLIMLNDCFVVNLSDVFVNGDWVVVQVLVVQLVFVVVGVKL